MSERGKLQQGFAGGQATPTAAPTVRAQPAAQAAQCRVGALAYERVQLVAVAGLEKGLDLALALGVDAVERRLDPAHEHHESEQHEREQQQQEGLNE